MDFLGVKIFFNSGSKTLFLGSLVGVFSSVLCVSVIDRSFCSRIACVFSLSSLELFLSRYFVSCFCSPFAFKRPFLGVCLV
ncbi:hypothetical protein [Helicobacter pylori]|uniref:hypothetical protein n=1 Tax=Helicobacter pylori TaxID=210 RepID=UPI0013E3BCAA|nr:hypothetical protein [Helicobacter pylori]